MTVWCVKGIPDDRLMKVVVGADGQLFFSTGGSINVSSHMKRRMQIKEVVLPGKLPEDNPSLIINEISNPETHSETLAACADLCARFDCPVINAPEKVRATTREQVSKKLAGIQGLRVPRTILCTPESPAEVLEVAEGEQIAAPFLIRETGQHGGNTLLRIEAGDDAGQLHQLAYDGRNFNITEFVDFCSPDGLYRKYRVVVIGGKAFLRHLIVADGWKIHAAQRSDQHPERDAEELFELANFSSGLSETIQPIADAASKALKLDYFGIDGSFARDREAVLFEANPNMNITYSTRADMAPYVDGPMDALAELVHKLLGASRQHTRRGGSRR